MTTTPKLSVAELRKIINGKSPEPTDIEVQKQVTAQLLEDKARAKARNSKPKTAKKLASKFIDDNAPLTSKTATPVWKVEAVASSAIKEIKTAEDRTEDKVKELEAVAEVYRSLSLAGDAVAAQVYLKFQSEISKLQGLYAPTRTELTGAHGGPLQVDTVDLSAIPLNDLKTIYSMLQIESK